MKKIKVYSTNGRTNVDIETEAANFGELKRDLSSNNISYDGMRAVIGENKNTLEVDSATLPDGDFTLFLTPKKIKSGAGERFKYYAQIKAIIERDGQRARDHFNSGKNYTNKSTEELGYLINQYGGIAPTGNVSVATNVTDVIESPKATTIESINLDNVREALIILHNIDLNEFERAKLLLDSFLKSISNSSVEEDPYEKERIQLENEAAEIAREFGNMY